MKNLGLILLITVCFWQTANAFTTLNYSTYVSGTGNVNDYVRDVTFDESGNFYATGGTSSSNFQTTSGAYDQTYNGSMDIFVRKYSAAGVLQWSTYLGGANYDRAYAIETDSSGNVYVGGRCGAGFPTTSGVVQPNFAGDSSPSSLYGQQDGCVAKLNSSGGLVWSTYWGSSSFDFLRDIDVDSNGNVYLMVAELDRANTPAGSPNTFGSTHHGGRDGQLVKLNSTATRVMYYGYIGGSGDDCPTPAVRVNSSGEAFVACETESTNAFVSANAAQNLYAGGLFDLYVAKINAAGTSIAWATYAGGSGNEWMETHGLALDRSSNVFLAGGTTSRNLPARNAGFQANLAGGSGGDWSGDGFIMKIASNGQSFVQTTYLGTSGNDSIQGIAVDESDNIVVSGNTDSSAFPVTADAYQRTKSSGQEGVFVKFSNNLNMQIYSTFYGGNGIDYFRCIDVQGGKVIHGGETTSSNFHTTQGANQTSYNGSRDGVLSIIDYGTLTNNSANAKFDFDGDDKTDISVFRPSLGQWWYRRSSVGDIKALQFGASTDKAVPADFTGDGKTDVALWRPATGEWFILRSEDFSFYAFPFGSAGDIPSTGDYDGDGKTDAAVFRPQSGTWYINLSTGGTTIQSFGLNGDKPVVEDYDGDGKDDIAVFRASGAEWWINRSQAGIIAFQFGTATDKIVPGDYTGDGKADAAIWRPSNGSWYVIRSENFSHYSFPFGISGDLPVPGDYDGDGKMDAAVFRPSSSNWFINGSVSGLQIFNFGLTQDIPLPSLLTLP